MKILKLLILICFIITATGCATKGLLPQHNHKVLLDIPINKSTPTLTNLKGKTFVVELENDLTLQPVGGYLHPGASMTLLEQSYVISQPGYVLLEKVSSTLEKLNSKVFRKYSKNIMNSSDQNHTVISINLNNFEFHYLEDDEDSSYLSRATLRCKVTKAGKNNVVEKQIDLRVPTNVDVFEAIAANIVQNIN